MHMLYAVARVVRHSLVVVLSMWFDDIKSDAALIPCHDSWYFCIRCFFSFFLLHVEVRINVFSHAHISGHGSEVPYIVHNMQGLRAFDEQGSACAGTRQLKTSNHH